MSNPVHERIQSDIGSRQRRGALHEGHARVPAMRILGRGGADSLESGREVQSVDVLKDPEIRQGIKEFSNWPTIPQLYVKGEFVGGCDIIREMFEAEELTPFFAERGVALEKV
jgi:Grx4 family monothiol glutaredoxin